MADRGPRILLTDDTTVKISSLVQTSSWLMEAHTSAKASVRRALVLWGTSIILWSMVQVAELVAVVPNLVKHLCIKLISKDVLLSLEMQRQSLLSSMAVSLSG